MKAIKQILDIWLAGVVVMGFLINFSACSEQSPLSSTGIDASLSKRDARTSDALSSSSTSATNDAAYPQSASRTLFYQADQGDGTEGAYEGGTINVPGGSTFHLHEGALTPPPGTPVGEAVTISMLVEKNATGDEFIFTFGPHGSQFDPPAEVWFDWTDLGSKNAKLFYIDDNGNYVEMQPDRVDRRGQRMLLRIPHFSRYAVAWSN